MEELEAGSAAIAKGGMAKNEVFVHPLPFNVIPHIDKFLDDAYTKEEVSVRLVVRHTGYAAYPCFVDLRSAPVALTHGSLFCGSAR